MFLHFDIFEPYADRIVHGITTRVTGSLAGEDPSFEDRLEKLGNEIGSKPAFAMQTHSDIIIKIDERFEKRPEADALMTDQRGLPIGIKIADCQVILLFDPVKNAIAAVHSGWRGSEQDIIGKTVKKMAQEFGSNPSDLLAGVSPSIGPCCFEFSDPGRELAKPMHPYVKNSKLDFWSLSLRQLQEAGVKSIELKALCTKCHPDRFFSHRNKDKGRMAVFIGLR